MKLHLRKQEKVSKQMALGIFLRELNFATRLKNKNGIKTHSTQTLINYNVDSFLKQSFAQKKVFLAPKAFHFIAFVYVLFSPSHLPTVLAFFTK